MRFSHFCNPFVCHEAVLDLPNDAPDKTCTFLRKRQMVPSVATLGCQKITYLATLNQPGHIPKEYAESNFPRFRCSLCARWSNASRSGALKRTEIGDSYRVPLTFSARAMSSGWDRASSRSISTWVFLAAVFILNPIDCGRRAFLCCPCLAPQNAKPTVVHELTDELE